MENDCIFCRIGAGSVPADVVYEDGEFVAFRDIRPQAPCHIVVIPRRHIGTILDMDSSELLGRYLAAACAAARTDGVDAGGFRIVVNHGADGGQEVPHVHLHLLGGRCLGWPPG